MTASPPPPPGDEDGRAPFGADGHPPLGERGLRVPDDISELADEVEAYRREQRAAARRARLRRILPFHRILPHRRWPGVSGPVVVAALLVIGMVGALLTVFGPRVRQPIAAPVPLAKPTVKAGQRGGLLPAGSVRTQSGALPTSLIRSAVVVLLPAPCRCTDLLRQVIGQSREVYRLNAYLVASPSEAAEAGDLATAVSGPTQSVVDDRGLLAGTYHADRGAPTVLLVSDDGIVLNGPQAVHQGDHLETFFAAYQPTG